MRSLNQQLHSLSGCTWSNNSISTTTLEILLLFFFPTTSGRMQVPNRSVGAYGYSVRNYAPASLFPQYQGSQCSSSTKPPSGKSFTIDALLAKPEDTTGGRSSPSQCGVKYQPAAPVLPLNGHVGLPMAPAPYVYSPNMLHSAVHSQPGYSIYCCPPFTYQSTCRGAFYAQGKLSVWSDLFEPTEQNCKRTKANFVRQCD